jgi:hypothetical protein
MRRDGRWRTGYRLVPTGGFSIVPFRLAFLAALAAAVLATAAAAAPRPAASISPGLIHRGQSATITVHTTGTAPCTALLDYARTGSQVTAAKRPRNGRASFVIRIPLSAGLGPGHWRVSCGLRAFSGTFVVVDAVSTPAVQAPRVVVKSNGFRQRNDKTGLGSLLSYGLLLQNTSPKEDAEQVYVIVNMVAADGSLIGSKAQTVAVVPAGATEPLGDSLELRTQVPATHLEITVRVGAHEPAQPRTVPDLANVRVLPSPYDPGFVGEVDGEVVNDTSPKTLGSAQLSIVLLDASGQPIGGGTGLVFSPVPSGSRFVFTAQNGFKAVPIDQAASAVIGVVPRYQTGP